MQKQEVTKPGTWWVFKMDFNGDLKIEVVDSLNLVQKREKNVRGRPRGTKWEPKGESRWQVDGGT